MVVLMGFYSRRGRRSSGVNGVGETISTGSSLVCDFIVCLVINGIIVILIISHLVVLLSIKYPCLLKQYLPLVLLSGRRTKTLFEKREGRSVYKTSDYYLLELLPDFPLN
jgi:hypothetical protein